MSANEPTKLHFVQGESVRYPITIREGGTQNPIDLTGATFTAPIREEFNKPVIGNVTINLTDATNGQFEFIIDSTDSAALPINKYNRKSFVFEVRMVLGGQTSIPLYGYLVVTRGV